MNEDLFNWSLYYLNNTIESKLCGFKDERCDAGDKVVCVYQDDIKWLKEEFKVKLSPKNIHKYLNQFSFTIGMLVPTPHANNARGPYSIIEETFLCILDYQCEKCNPEVEYVNTCKVLGFDDLIWMVKI